MTPIRGVFSFCVCTNAVHELKVHLTRTSVILVEIRRSTSLKESRASQIPPVKIYFGKNPV